MLTYTFSKNMPTDQHRKKPTPSRFSDDHYAANVPEFVNIGPGAIKKIRISAQR